MIVVFQGYPYNNGKERYNQFVVAGASINRLNTFYVVPQNNYFIYHKEGCSQLVKDTVVKTCYSLEDCAKAGAFACEKCHPEGRSY